ncbi:hypothetical protein [Bacillus sp. 2205SS5-2]|uniref:hypothetical protein n=1 Tax=Bacillus sp. 2205SS5-2 TaxID=3109031 RepID=UPI0030063ADF
MHFDFQDDVFRHRITQSQRSPSIFRSTYSSFEEVLQLEDALKDGIKDPKEGETDHLFVLIDNMNIESDIQEVIQIAQC